MEPRKQTHKYAWARYPHQRLTFMLDPKANANTPIGDIVQKGMNFINAGYEGYITVSHQGEQKECRVQTVKTDKFPRYVSLIDGIEIDISKVKCRLESWIPKGLSVERSERFSRPFDVVASEVEHYSEVKGKPDERYLELFSVKKYLESLLDTHLCELKKLEDRYKQINRPLSNSHHCELIEKVNNCKDHNRECEIALQSAFVDLLNTVNSEELKSLLQKVTEISNK